MTKRILSLLLAAMMVLGSIIVVSAAEEEIDYDVENAFAIDVLKDINVLQGYDEDDFALDAAIKRYEMSLFIARALTGKTKDTYWEGAKNETPFTDLDGFKYAGSTTWTYNHGIILGKDNKTFDPNGYITYQEAIAMVLRAWADYYVEGGLKTLKIDDAIHYPWRHIELVEYLDLDANIDPTTKYTDVLSRGAVAQLIFNLLTFDPDDFAELGTGNFWAVKADEEGKYPTMAEEKFGLTLSDAEGVLVELGNNAKPSDKGIFTNSIVKFNEDGIKTGIGSIANLSTAHFEEFDVEPEADVFYNIIYFTRREIKENPFTGEVSFPADGKVETVVLSIEKVTIDDLIFTNVKGATPEYSLQVETTESKDGKAVKKALVSITAGDVVYPTIGKDALKVRVMTDINVYTDYVAADKLGTVADDGKVGGIAVDTIDPIIKLLSAPYADLRVEDTNGDGKIDTLTVVPYVFTGIYTETATGTKKATTWKLTGYSVVRLDKVTAKGGAWEKACANDDGEYKVNFTVPNTTDYAAKDSVSTIVDAETVTGILAAYNVRANNTNYIKIGDTSYGYKYEALKGWSAATEYYALTAQDVLFGIYENQFVDDEDLADNQVKYLKAWILDGNVVALVGVDPEGEEVEDTPVVTPDTVYTGVIDFIHDDADDNLDVAFPATNIDIDSDNVKVIGGKYYLVVPAAYVDGVYTKDVLVYLADATTFSGNTYGSAYTIWHTTETNKITTMANAIKQAIGTKGLVFYTADALGNVEVSIVVADVVNADNYAKYVGSKSYVQLLDKDGKTYLANISGDIEYTMDTRADDIIEFNLKIGEAVKADYEHGIAKADTEWLFIDTTNGETKSAFGIPEFGSNFTTSANEKGFAFMTKGNQIIVFVDTLADVNGFKYTMHQDALYALVDEDLGLLDKGIRDGNLYFSVKDLFSGEKMEIVIDEDAPLAETLKGYALNTTTEYMIVAVTESKHELLEVYGTDAKSVNAIAQLTGDNTLVLENVDLNGDGDYVDAGESIVNVNTKSELEQKIKNKFNLTAVETILMGANSKNLIYSVVKTANNDYKVVHQAGMPLVSDQAEYYVFFTPATAKEDARYVVFIYDAGTIAADTAFADAVAAGTATIALTQNVTTANTIELVTDTTINLGADVTLSVGTIETNGYDLTIKGGKVVGTNTATTDMIGTNSYGAAITAINGSKVTLNKTTVEIAGYIGVQLKDSTLNVVESTIQVATGATGSSCPDGIRAFGESTVTIDGKSKVYGDATVGSALELYDKASATIEKGAVLSGGYGVIVYGGTLVTSGDISAKANGNAITISNYTPDTSASVTVKDGIINGALVTFKANRKDDAATTNVNETVTVKIELAGGTYNEIVDVTGATTDDTKVTMTVTGKIVLKAINATTGFDANFEIASGSTATIVDGTGAQLLPVVDTGSAGTP